MDMSPQAICAVDDGYVNPGNMCSGRWICHPRQYVQWTMDMSPQSICAVDDGYKYKYKYKYKSFIVNHDAQYIEQNN
jgi:hypothetical protein